MYTEALGGAQMEVLAACERSPGHTGAKPHGAEVICHAVVAAAAGRDGWWWAAGSNGEGGGQKSRDGMGQWRQFIIFFQE